MGRGNEMRRGWELGFYRDQKGAGELATTGAPVFSRQIVSQGILTKIMKTMTVPKEECR